MPENNSARARAARTVGNSFNRAASAANLRAANFERRTANRYRR